MLKLALIICANSSVFIFVNGAIYFQGYFTYPENPGTCSLYNKVYSAGEYGPYPFVEGLGCARFKCENDQGFGTVEICDPPQLTSEIRTYSHDFDISCKHGDFDVKDKPFPECCSRSISCIG